MPLTGKTFAELACALAAGETSGRALIEAALEAIAADPRAFTRLNPARARAEAGAADASRALGHAASAFAGIPVSVKDLFDIEGEPTAAGSLILTGGPPAQADAPVVARLRAAGLVVIGATHMSEFAFTGLGLNPHYPEPPNPHDPERVPGGSSGGAAGRRSLWRSARPPARSAPTPGARCASRRRSAAWSGSSRRNGA
jgi:aspartyl-tRNA(Asn)/glutamyl-tRNA(Gln) amidotransferase subunit A